MRALRRVFATTHTHYWGDVVTETSMFLSELGQGNVISVIEHENMIVVWYWQKVSEQNNVTP
jgi:hypothetical protein